MKQFHTLAVLLLVFANFGLTQRERLGEKSIDFTAQNLTDSPDNLLNPETAFTFIDTICGQKAVGPVVGEIYGAYNSETGDSMKWGEYVTTVGENGNHDYHMATGPWRTFSGSCYLAPESTWVENSITSRGSWEHNREREITIRECRIEINMVGFTAKTSTRTWYSRCQNVDLMANIFKAMPIPDRVLTTWKGLGRRAAESRYKTVPISLRPRFWGNVFATTMVRTVHAKMVLNIVEWNECYNDDSCSKTTGWLGMGGLWNYVYSPLAYVEASGLTQLVPESPLNPHEETCIVEEIMIMPRRPGL